METKPDRLKSAYGELIRRGLVSTQKDVAAKMKASVTNVSSAFNGNETYITDRFLMRFNAAFDNIFSPEWLRTGEGTMLRDEVPAVVEPMEESLPSRFVALLEKKEAQIERLQAQVERLIALLEKNGVH